MMMRVLRSRADHVARIPSVCSLGGCLNLLSFRCGGLLFDGHQWGRLMSLSKTSWLWHLRLGSFITTWQCGFFSVQWRMGWGDNAWFGTWQTTQWKGKDEVADGKCGVPCLLFPLSFYFFPPFSEMEEGWPRFLQKSYFEDWLTLLAQVGRQKQEVATWLYVLDGETRIRTYGDILRARSFCRPRLYVHLIVCASSVFRPSNRIASGLSG